MEGVVGRSAGASGAVVEAARALPGPLRDFSQDQRRRRNSLGGIVVVVVVAVAADEAGVAAGAAAVVVSRCGLLQTVNTSEKCTEYRERKQPE